ncbi:MAG: thiamine-phosphate kinase [Clostridia bacterium]|nr:thiamine-phosphate kinase [Clostridia bacterium]
MEKRVGDLGEFGLLDRLFTLVRRAEIPVGLGDDAAVLTVSPGRWLLVTTDTLVEEVHFRRAWASAWQVGYKALAVNLSDIAAMGGTPTYALISLAVPGSLSLSWVEDLYRGLEACAAQWGVRIVGGDTVAAASICLTVVLLGECEAGRVRTRGDGRAGDLLLVTGELGAAGAGLEELSAPAAACPPAARARVVARHLLPTPRLAEGRLLAAHPAVGAVIDLSDGLAQGVREIARASAVGAEIWSESLPLALATKEVAAAHGQDPLAWALYGGEDYELLFSVRPSAVAAVREELDRACGTPVRVIGCLLPPEAGLLVERAGERVPLARGGYDHFLQPGKNYG